MKDWIEVIKKWRSEKRLRKCQRVFATLYADKRSGIHEVVNAAGYRVGCGIAMGQLDRLRIQHCLFCPEIAPLLNNPDGSKTKLCQGHHKSILMKQAQADQKKEAENGKKEGLILTGRN